MRDFEIHGADLVVGTHGRGIWVIDDISVLRQLNDTVTKADAHLFKPADAIGYVQGDDNGTPTQKDEPQMPNPENGAVIDYYLRSAPTGAVTIEILDSAGASLRTFSSSSGGGANAAGGRGGGGIPNTSPLWRTTPDPISAAAGMHRVVWNPVSGGGGRGGGFGSGGGAPLTGVFTAKLTVGGQSYTQTFTVKPDPRVATR